MERYVGLDAHASSCTLAVLGPSGKRLGSHVVETNAKALTEILRAIPGPWHLCFEEGRWRTGSTKLSSALVLREVSDFARIVERGTKRERTCHERYCREERGE
jgi:hypothetical protein